MKLKKMDYNNANFRQNYVMLLVDRWIEQKCIAWLHVQPDSCTESSSNVCCRYCNCNFVLFFIAVLLLVFSDSCNPLLLPNIFKKKKKGGGGCSESGVWTQQKEKKLRVQAARTQGARTQSKPALSFMMFALCLKCRA